jgi:hypothetical protein
MGPVNWGRMPTYPENSRAHDIGPGSGVRAPTDRMLFLCAQTRTRDLFFDAVRERQNRTRTEPRSVQASARDCGLRLHQLKRIP